MLDDASSLHLIVRFAADSSKTLIRVRRVNKRLLNAVDFAMSHILQQDHENRITWSVVPTNANLNLQSLGYYEAVVAAGLLEKKKVPNWDKNIPKSVSRVLHLESILDSFPLVKAGWDEFDGVMMRTKNNMNVVEAIVMSMVKTGVLPNPNIVNWGEHINIHDAGRKRYRSHPLYEEYRGSVPANLHQFIDPEMFWDTIPLKLQLLISHGNKGKRW